MFDWVQVRSLAGCLKDIYRVVPEPPLHYPACVLGVIVLMEGGPLAQSEVQVFIKDIYILFSVQLSLNSDHSLCPCP